MVPKVLKLLAALLLVLSLALSTLAELGNLMVFLHKLPFQVLLNHPGVSIESILSVGSSISLNVDLLLVDKSVKLVDNRVACS